MFRCFKTSFLEGIHRIVQETDKHSAKQGDKYCNREIEEESHNFFQQWGGGGWNSVGEKFIKWAIQDD